MIVSGQIFRAELFAPFSLREDVLAKTLVCGTLLMSAMRDFAAVEEIKLKICLSMTQLLFALMRLRLYSICFGRQNGIKIKPVVVSSTQASSCQA